MREILFRGKRKDNGEWVYGDLIKNLIYDGREKEIRIGDIYFEHNGDIHGTAVRKVIPDTVGQFTGLTDKNGKKIFEGDIVKEDDCFHNGELQIKGNAWRVAFADGLFFGNYKDISVYLQSLDGMEVIGNIYDNPELLKEI